MNDPNLEPSNVTPESAGSPVRDRALRPPGLLPKNTQTYVILGLAVVMAGAIAFSGGGAPAKSTPASQKQQTVVDPNWARIQDYRNRIDEQARKLAAEQAQLEQAKQALGLPPGGASALPPQGAPSPGYGGNYPQREYVPPEPKPEKNPIEADKEKREYQSLFASNIALSLRKDGQPSPATVAANGPPNVSTLPFGMYYPMPAPPAPGARVANQPALVPQPQAVAPQERTEETDLERPSVASESSDSQTARKTAKNPALKQADGKLYRLFEGTIIETVLTNRLNGSFTGPVNCMVTTDVYSHDRQHVLIPKGSRVLGEVKRNDAFGQQRLAVSFHRLIMPDGYSVSLDKFRGLNQIGETGLRDQVNHHYGQVFGISLAVGAIAGLATVNTGNGFNASSLDSYRQGVSTNLSQSSLRILDRYLNVLPTFTIREGHRIKVVLSDDLELPALEGHKMPSDL